MSIEEPTLEELRLLAVCKGICDHYMGGYDGAGIHHSFMSAGEHAVSLLVEYGLMIKTGDGGVWTRRALALEAVDEITPSNVDSVRKRYIRASTDVLRMRGGSSPLLPDVEIMDLRLWFTGLAIQKSRKRPSHYPRLEPDRLDVLARHKLVDGHFCLSGELLRVRDLHTFRNQLIKLLDKGKGTARLIGIKRSLRVEIRRTHQNKFDCLVVTHNPSFDQTVQSNSHFENDNLVVSLVSQLGNVEAKFNDADP